MFFIWATNKGPEMATSKETKKFAKCREEIQTHTNGNDLTRDFTFRLIGFSKINWK
jgi:hypothetical protein